MANRCAILENRIRVLTRENADLTEVAQNYTDEIERLVKEATKPLHDEIRRLNLELETTRKISDQYQKLNSQLIAASPARDETRTSNNTSRTHHHPIHLHRRRSSSGEHLEERDPLVDIRMVTTRTRMRMLIDVKGEEVSQQQHDDRVRRVVSARRSNNRNMLPSPRRIRKTNDSAQNILLRNALPTPLMSQRSYNRLEHDEMKQRMFERIDAAMRRNPQRSSPSTSPTLSTSRRMSPPRSSTSESKRTNWSSRILRKSSMGRKGRGIDTTPIVRSVRVREFLNYFTLSCSIIEDGNRIAHIARRIIRTFSILTSETELCTSREHRYPNNAFSVPRESVSKGST